MQPDATDATDATPENQKINGQQFSASHLSFPIQRPCPAARRVRDGQSGRAIQCRPHNVLCACLYPAHDFTRLSAGIRWFIFWQLGFSRLFAFGGLRALSRSTNQVFWEFVCSFLARRMAFHFQHSPHQTHRVQKSVAMERPADLVTRKSRRGAHHDQPPSSPFQALPLCWAEQDIELQGTGSRREMASPILPTATFHGHSIQTTHPAVELNSVHCHIAFLCLQPGSHKPWPRNTMGPVLSCWRSRTLDISSLLCLGLQGQRS